MNLCRCPLRSHATVVVLGAACLLLSVHCAYGQNPERVIGSSNRVTADPPGISS
jgi:hypothetical protein